MAKAKKAKAEAAATETKVSNKGKKQFTLGGKAAKIREKFSAIYTLIPKSELEYRGKKGDVTAKRLVTVKAEDGTKSKVQKEYTGAEAKKIATERYYSVFGSRLNAKQSSANADAMNDMAIDAIKSFLSKHSTLEAQQKNGQQLLDVLMAIYVEPRVAGERKTREKKVKSAVTFDDL